MLSYNVIILIRHTTPNHRTRTMRNYYYNTTADNQNNMTLGYISEDGDYISSPGQNHARQKLIVKIIVEAGLLACRPFEEYLHDVVHHVCRELKINPDYYNY
jgi:hypothetical protein